MRRLIAASMLLLGLAGALPACAATLNFRDALTLALARDPQVGGAREQAEIVDAQAAQARSHMFPQAGLTSNYGKGADTDFGTLPVDRVTNRTEAFVRMNLFNGLTDQTLIGALAHDRRAALGDLQHALEDACERTAVAYYDALRWQRLSVSSQRRLREVEALGQRVEQLAAAGRGSQADAQLAAASMIEARLNDETVRAEWEGARVKLQSLIGEVPAELDDATVLPELGASTDFEDLLTQARAQNAQWLAAMARVDAARVRVGLVAPEYLPKLDVDLRKQLSDHTAPADTTTQRHAWTFSLTYQVPLGGEADARRDEARHRAAAAEAEVSRVADYVRADLGATQQRVIQTVSAAPQYERQIGYLDTVVRAGELQYEAGRRSLQQLIELRDSRYTAEQRRAENAYLLVTSRLHLLLLTGGLARSLGVNLPE